MELLKIFELLFYHISLQMILEGWNIPCRIMILISCIYQIVKILSKTNEAQSEKKLLQQLNTLIAMIESGNSPRYSYESIGPFDIPSIFIHPCDIDFRLIIFKNQTSLFEKRVLLREDLRSEFSVVRYRMKLMKLLPIIMILTLKLIMPNEVSEVIQIITVIGFLLTYYLSEYWIQSV